MKEGGGLLGGCGLVTWFLLLVIWWLCLVDGGHWLGVLSVDMCCVCGHAIHV